MARHYTEAQTMTKDEYIGLRIAELTVRQNYCEQLVMNRDLTHEAKMCALQIELLIEMQDALRETVLENPLPKIGPLVRYWVNDDTPPHLMHTDNHGRDTVLCENHLTGILVACSNCVQPWPTN